MLLEALLGIAQRRKAELKHPLLRTPQFGRRLVDHMRQIRHDRSPLVPDTRMVVVVAAAYHKHFVDIHHTMLFINRQQETLEM
jgi:hypothetical protein